MAKQNIDRLEAWRILLKMETEWLQLGRQEAMKAMYELEEGMTVTWTDMDEPGHVVELRLRNDGGEYSLEQEGGDGLSVMHGLRADAILMVSETVVPDLSQLYPLTAQDVDELLAEALGAMEALRDNAAKYRTETGDEALRARLERLNKIASAMITELESS